MGEKTVGIPRALLYHKYFYFWKAFFEALGLRSVVSPPTNERLLKEGLRRCVSDFCLPVKAALGHVDNLRDWVDFLFVPRYISVEEDAYMCPKLLGLPDVIKASFSRLPVLLAPPFNLKAGRKNAENEFITSVAAGIGAKFSTVRAAFESVRAMSWKPSQEEPAIGATTIAVLGRHYLLRDDYLNGGVFGAFRSMGVNPVSREPSPEEVDGAMRRLKKRVYWSLGRETVALAAAYIDDPRVDGMAHITAAACGPDSFIAEVIKNLNREKRKPFMPITLDEHTSHLGVRTRLEAFADMIAMGAQTR